MNSASRIGSAANLGFETPFSGGTASRDLQARATTGGGGGLGTTSTRQTQHQQQQQQPAAPAPAKREEFVNDDADQIFRFDTGSNNKNKEEEEKKSKEYFTELLGPHLFQTGWACPVSVAERVFATNIQPFFAECGCPTPPYSFRLFNGIVNPETVLPPLAGAFVPNNNSASISSGQATTTMMMTPANFKSETERRGVLTDRALDGMQALIVLFPRQHLGHALDILSGAQTGAAAAGNNTRRSRGGRNTFNQHPAMDQQQQQQMQQDYPIKIKCSTGEGRDRAYVVSNYSVAAGRQCTCGAFTHQVLSSSAFATCKHVLALNLAFGFVVPANPPPPPLQFDEFWTKLPPTPQLDQPVSPQGGDQLREGDLLSEQQQPNDNDDSDGEEERPLFAVPDNDDGNGQPRKQQQQQPESIVDSSTNASPALLDPGQKISVCAEGAVAWISAAEDEVRFLMTV